MRQVKGMARTLMVVVLIIVVGGGVTRLYLILTYPRSVVSFSAYFTIGADV